MLLEPMVIVDLISENHRRRHRAQPLPRHLRHVQVAQLRRPVRAQEHVSGLQVAVQDVQLVKGQALHQLNENLPNVRFLKKLPRFLVLHDFLVQITVVRVLHYYAQRAVLLVEKRLFVTYHELRFHTRQNSHLVKYFLPNFFFRC